ncbi:MAG: flippase [Patescibacteria group bacterium]|nr:flippase [Patescibacteria group bacterium]MDD5164166.1 flippase [Patescibacteria group bacterium]MDD5534500.1 flippase [Patescibacteria group bacterium]
MSSTAKNTLYLFFARIYQKLTALFYYFLLARYLGVADFGKITFTLSFVAIFAAFIDFGLNALLARETAREKSKTKIYLGNILGIKFIFSILIFAVVFIVINLLHYPIITKNLIYLGTIFIILCLFADTLYFAFRGYFNFKYEAVGIIINQTIVVAAGLIFMKLKFGLLLIFMPYIFGSLFYLINALVLFKRCTGFKLKLFFDQSFIRNLLKVSFPFFIAGLIGVLYINIDTVLLSRLADDRAMGWYNAAKRLILSLLFLIPIPLSAAIYPTLSRHFISSRQDFSRVFQEAIFYLFLILCPIFLGTLILARPIISLLYGNDYLNAVAVLQILILAMPLMFFDNLVISLLNASNRQKNNMINQGIGLVLLIIFSFILIPLFSQRGAAIAYLLSYIILFILEIYWVLKLVNFKEKYFFKKMSKILLSGLIMAGGLLIFKTRLNVVFSTLLGIIIYGAFIYFLGVIKRGDILEIKNLIFSKNIPQNLE